MRVQGWDLIGAPTEGEVELAVRRVTDDAVGRALGADEAREPAGIHAGHADEIHRLQPGVEMLGRAPVRRLRHVLLHHDPAGGYSARFDGSDYKPTLQTGGLLYAPDKVSWQLAREALFAGAELPVA